MSSEIYLRKKNAGILANAMLCPISNPFAATQTDSRKTTYTQHDMICKVGSRIQVWIPPIEVMHLLNL